jgi:hypothetical protein
MGSFTFLPFSQIGKQNHSGNGFHFPSARRATAATDNVSHYLLSWPATAPL